MKNIINNYLYKLCALTIILASANIATFAQQTNFSGTYTLNETKTDFGHAPHSIVPAKYKIEQGTSQLTLITTSLDANGKEVNTTRLMNYDGRPTESTQPDGSKRTAILNWDPNKKGLTIKAKLTKADGSLLIAVSDHWTLEDNGKAFIVTRDTEQGDGFKYTTKVYYDKQ